MKKLRTRVSFFDCPTFIHSFLEAPKVWVPTNLYDPSTLTNDQRQLAIQYNMDNDLRYPEGIPNRTLTAEQAISMEEHPRPSSSTSSAAPHVYRNFTLAPFSAQSSVVSPSQVGSPSGYLTDDVDMEHISPPTNTTNNTYHTPPQQFRSPMSQVLPSPPPSNFQHCFNYSVFCSRPAARNGQLKHIPQRVLWRSTSARSVQFRTTAGSLVSLALTTLCLECKYRSMGAESMAQPIALLKSPIS
jgi:hypothetical protein